MPGVRGDPPERRDAVGRRQVRPAAGGGGRDDGDPERPIRCAAPAPRMAAQERLVAGQELAAAVERDRPGHDGPLRRRASMRPALASGGVTFFIGGCTGACRRPPRRTTRRDPVRARATNGAR